LVSVAAVPLKDDGVNEPQIPEDMQEDLLAGAIAEGLLLIDEDVQGAQLHQARFDAMVTKLRIRVNARIGGDGPSQIQVASYHFTP
jgi:hypothetical protein